MTSAPNTKKPAHRLAPVAGVDGNTIWTKEKQS